jgi:hypothetical protein
MCHSLGELAVVSQQQDAGARHIQAADRVKRPEGSRQKPHHRGPGTGIGPGGHVAGRLVQDEVPARPMPSLSNSIYSDIRRFRICLGAQFLDQFPVYTNPALGDHLLSGSAGSNAGSSNYFL